MSNDDMDMAELVNRYNAMIEQKSEEIGRLKQKVEDQQEIITSLMAERALFHEEHDYSIEFEPDWDSSH